MRGGVAGWLPVVSLLRGYRIGWLSSDLGAGAVLTAILVPAGMGYAQAAGLPAICGLYASMASLVAYFIFGPSRILVLGPDSALAAMIAATVLPMAAGDSERAVALAGMLSILTGALCIVAGLVKFGFITDLISTPIRYGYLNGIALTVIVGQLPKLLGFGGSGNDLVEEARGLALGIAQGRINWTAFAIGVACLIVIFAFKRWAPRIPGVLLAVVGATIAATVLPLTASSGLDVVGRLPQGLPEGTLPAVSFDDVSSLFAGAVAIALVSFADMSVLSRTFAMRGGHMVDGNQEILALGAANVASGLFQGFPVSSSASRTPVAEAAGAKTQLTGLVGAGCIALLLLAAPGLVENLPTAALGAVVIAASLALVEVRGVLRLYRLRISEFALSIVCFLGVSLLGVIQGIFIAVGLALLAFIWRAWRPYDAVLGRVEGMKGYHDISRHPEARRIPGLVLFRWDAPLFFANAAIFEEHVLRAVAAAPTPTRWIVVAAEPVTDVDVTAADMLTALDGKLHEAGIELCFAEMKGPVKDRLKRYGLFNRLGAESFFATLGQSVDRYLAAHDVEWKDWDE
ncbi:MAG TPA: SulP family inorganic anion transporter [Casimicrobiaceae bacterium]|nr:SulP family inorganic anion transporter [Casimicrobiaceae bacterium]